MNQKFSKADMSANKFSMLCVLKRMAVLAVLALSVQVSHGFALLGPFEAYQIPAIGYRWVTYDQATPGGVVGYSDLGGPHNLAEEYRRNTPVLFYACDANFLEFFGSNGVAAVDEAFGMMNSLTNVSMYTPDLLEFPLASQRINYEAQNLFLTDVKSMTLHLIVKEMGLTEPDHYTWTLKDRTVQAPPPCPASVEYLVIMRNFDIVPSSLQQVQYSPYVNGTLYTYGIVENCNGALLAYTVPFAVDLQADTYTAVASEPINIFTGSGQVLGLNVGATGLKIGGFYTYLTRDDMAGLRYLLQTNNYNFERSGPDTVQFVTNDISPTPLPTFDLGLLLSLARTSNAAQLQAIFPGLIDTATQTGFQLITNLNLVIVATNPPFAPAGFQLFTIVPSGAPIISAIPTYTHTFDNILTNQFSARSQITIQTVTAGLSPFGGGITTNVTTVNVTTKRPAGEFYVIPPGLCGVVLRKDLLNLPQVTATTNVVFDIGGLAAGGTNIIGTISQTVITYFTNHLIAYQPITCPPNTTGLRQGIERVRFVRRDFDSLIGTFWEPATNEYTLNQLTNSVLVPQRIRRVVTQPDFLFTADDLAQGPQIGVFPPVDTVLVSPANFNQVAVNNLAGPGTIENPTRFTFNKVGFLNFNYTAATIVGNGSFNSDFSSAIQGLLWASYDGTTNEPVIYPNGVSINNLIAQLLIRVEPQLLPDAVANSPYSFTYTNSITGAVYNNTFSATGAQAPYTWTLAPNSAGLPAGLSLSSDGQLTGTPGGPPGIYDFTIRATDANNRIVDVPYSINIQ
jgi:hypothetical protein